jgi:hypothetical protein
MSAPLLTPAELGEQLGLDEAAVLKLRKRHHWPHVRLTRWDIRFTEAQAEQIVAQHTVTGSTPTPAATSKIAGQTSRSARRSA